MMWPTLSIRRSSASARKLPALPAGMRAASRSVRVRVAVVTGRPSAQVTSYGASTRRCSFTTGSRLVRRLVTVNSTSCTTRSPSCSSTAAEPCETTALFGPSNGRSHPGTAGSSRSQATLCARFLVAAA